MSLRGAGLELRFVMSPLVILLCISGCGSGLCVNGLCPVRGITCPSGYLAVQPNTAVLVTSAFCVAKYEMKNNGSDSAVSEVTGTPWVNISRDDGGGTPPGPGAITRCRNIGAGYDLISNAQWQAVAREIEQVQSAGVYVNWSNGSIDGANALNRGHSDNVPPNALAASTDSDPCFGTGNAGCADNTNFEFTQKRTHTLASGETIWDIAGNVWELVKGDIAAGPPFEGVNTFISQLPWIADLNRPEMWGPFGGYVSKNSGNFGGLGYGYLGFSGGGIFRGGFWSNGPQAGIFSANLNGTSLNSDSSRGFRCVWVP